jgi:hypothetical protein
LNCNIETVQTNTNVTSQQQILLLTSLDQSSQNSSSLNQNSTTKPIRSTNVELPLSVLNPAALINPASSSIGLHINPFVVSKNSSAPSPSAMTPVSKTSGIAEDDMDAESGGDQTDSAAKNAKLLESYKAIKASQLAKEKDKSVPIKTAYSPSQMNPAQSASSASPNRTLESSIAGNITLNSAASVSMPSIIVATSFNNEPSAAAGTATESDINVMSAGSHATSGNFDESDENNDESDDEEDVQNASGEQVEFDTESFVNSDDDYENTICSFNESEDTQSQMTEITGFDKSPASVKRLDKTSMSEKQMRSLKKDKQKICKFNMII